MNRALLLVVGVVIVVMVAVLTVPGAQDFVESTVIGWLSSMAR